MSDYGARMKDLVVPENHRIRPFDALEDEPDRIDKPQRQPCAMLFPGAPKCCQKQAHLQDEGNDIGQEQLPCRRDASRANDPEHQATGADIDRKESRIEQVNAREVSEAVLAEIVLGN